MLDFGLSEDSSDDDLYKPSEDLFWDTFHIGIDKLHGFRANLMCVSRGLADQFENKLNEKYSLQLFGGWSRQKRRSPESAPLAEQLRKIVRSYRPKSPENNIVLPFIGGDIDNYIINGLNERYQKDDR